MDIIEEIKNTKNEEEIIKIINKKIEEEEKVSKKLNNHTVIGAELEINPRASLLFKDDEEKYCEYNGYYLGFIPKGTKINYGTLTSFTTGLQFTGGFYYYMDDYTYIYEFAKFIKDKVVESEFDIIGYTYAFLKYFFEKNINRKDRDNIHTLICKTETDYYKPLKEHSIKDFFHNGAALCSEYSSATSNILNVFGITTYYIQDMEHAYNIFVLPNNEKNEYYLLDTTVKVGAYNLENKDFYEEAYIEELQDFDDNSFYDFLYKREPIKLQDYYLIYYQDRYSRIYYDSYREYGIESDYSVKIEKDSLIITHKK